MCPSLIFIYLLSLKKYDNNDTYNNFKKQKK